MKLTHLAFIGTLIGSSVSSIPVQAQQASTAEKAITTIAKTPAEIYEKARRVDFDSREYTDLLVKNKKENDKEWECANFKTQDVQYNKDEQVLEIWYGDDSVSIVMDGKEFQMSKVDTYEIWEDKVFRFKNTRFVASNTFFSVHNLSISFLTQKKVWVRIDREVRAWDSGAKWFESKVWGNFKKEE